MGVAGGAAGGAKLGRREHLGQFPPAGFPSALELALGTGEGVGKAAPADVAGEGALLIGRRAAVLGLQGFQQADGGEVVVELLDLAALAKADLIGDGEVDGRNVGGV